MKVARRRQQNGHDPRLGPYTTSYFGWYSGSTFIFETSIQVFSEQAVAIFGQHFPNGSTSRSEDNQEVLSAFPTIHSGDLSTLAADLHYLTFVNTFAVPVVGKWNQGVSFPSGAVGGFPLVLHNQAARAMVVSPLGQFMVASQSFSSHLEHRFACGLLSTLREVPTDFVYQTIVVYGDGVADTLYKWGDILLNKYGKRRASLKADNPAEFLGYWTDNGAYYYYNTQAGQNYAQTMANVKRSLDSLRLPVHNYEFDSWWYYKDTASQALVLWEPMPSVFPDGMTAVYEALGKAPLTLHNRYFAAKNDYCQDFECIIEPDVDMALPLDPRLYEYMMGKAKPWGLAVYEQDWLVTTYMKMSNTRTNITSARQWLLAMGDAALKLDITIVYCMPLHRHLLQSLEVMQVISSRASDDYQPGNDQWAIGYTSMLHHALGLIPFKDTFWSNSSYEPGCPYKTPCVEPNAELQALVATLSTGPVGFSDGIGHVDADRVMRTCRQDGTLLKPDRPALPLDLAFAMQYHPGWNPSHPIQAWHSVSSFVATDTQRFTWHYVLAADLPYEIILHPEDLGREEAPTREYVAFNFHNLPRSVAVFNASQPIRIAVQPRMNGTVGFKYYVVAPVLSDGWSLLGEVGKFVTMSRQRILALNVAAHQFSARLAGRPGEVVQMAAVQQAYPPYVLTIHCRVGDDSSALLTCQTSFPPSCSC